MQQVGDREDADGRLALALPDRLLLATPGAAPGAPGGPREVPLVASALVAVDGGRAVAAGCWDGRVWLVGP